ncbi:PilW family protein [Azotobacter beijerinckii]|uniref:PilW family protein n=1 Tax=Azotobacter beijerinckii TaxID=170623 RepID=UPI002952B1D2|nr:PilW family protein [Azotobacter beijerinckii]MDV7210385.1 PilW family protein [Azotobacter beijerinckii]
MNKPLDRRRGPVRHVFIHSAQCGFNLIELMVASTIGLLIMTAVLTLFLNVTRTNDEMAKTNMLIENGRFAIQLLQNDIAHAGFWDTYIPDFDDLTLPISEVPVELPTKLPDPCLAYSSWPGANNENVDKNLLGVAVQVHDSVPSGCDTLLANRKANTDILVVRHADTCVAGAVGCESKGDDNKLYFQSSRCKTEVAYKLATTEPALHQRNCKDVAPKRKFVSNIYYIRDYAVAMGDAIPTLVRSEFDLASDVVKAMAPVALIEGIEDFRVELGIDRKSETGIDVISDSNLENRYTAAINWADDNLTSPINRGDGVPDGEFVHCPGVCSVDSLVNVVAVKLYLLVRSQVSSPGYVDSKSYTLGEKAIAAANDGFKRHVFSTVVRLNNISGRRDTP